MQSSSDDKSMTLGHPLETLAYRISARSRARKYAQFLTLMQPAPTDTLLDVGVNAREYSATDNFLEKHYPYPANITVVSTDDLAAFRARYPHITAVTADGRSLPFADKSYTIVYSNAVIEHVGDEEAQLRFLRELIRVSERGYLTTPNRLFPVEVHTRVPLLHLVLPRALFHAWLRLIGKTWATGDYMHLLSERELRALVGKAGLREYTLLKNRFLFFPMTFTLVWKKD